MRTFLIDRHRSLVRFALVPMSFLTLSLAAVAADKHGYTDETLAGIIGGLLSIYVSLAAGLTIAAAGPLEGRVRWLARGAVLVVLGGGFAWGWFSVAHFAGSSWIGAGAIASVVITVLMDLLTEPPAGPGRKLTVQCCSCLAADASFNMQATRLGARVSTS